MSTASVLPDIDDCVRLYLTAYERVGTEPFAAERLDPDVRPDDRGRLLDLAVAYGLLTFDGSRYAVRCPPDASPERWRSRGAERATRVRRAVSERHEPDGSPAEADTLALDGRTYASAFVLPSDDVATVAGAVAAARGDDHDGVVLRSRADLANEVQRLADRLGDRSEIAGTSLSTPMRKESTDVAGDHKDDLEFRLFLRPD
ncbi:hypothetical protein [Halobaculum sp. EA56]|uniref:hypothetical protein n=1 Tax=Halobaculum sp. EA56 TaxID=3421648 RepID=UPI003EB8851B